MNAQELREKRQRLYQEMQDLVATAETEKRELDNAKYDKMFADWRSLGNLLEIAESEEARAAKEAESAAKQDAGEVDVRAINKNFLDNTREIAKKKGSDQILRVFHDKSFSKESRTAIQTVTTTGGGYLIPTTTASDLEKAMLWYGPMLGVSNILTTQSANPMNFPTTNDTNNKGYQIDINTSAITDAVSLSFAQVPFGAYKYTSGLIQIPNELSRDNIVGLNSYISEALGERIGRAINYDATIGGGTTGPKGVVTAATSSAITALVSSITRDNLVDLKFSVDKAYRDKPGAGYMFSDSTLKAILKLYDTDRGPIYQVSAIAGQPDTIEGVPFYINNDMASIGAGEKSVLFGDYSKFRIRLVQNMRIMSSNERFMEFDQTGIVAWWEWDSDLMDAGTHPIKYLVHAAS